MATEKTKDKVKSQETEDMHKQGKNGHRYKTRGMLMGGQKIMEKALSLGQLALV
jgi:hypothetical protein